MAENILHDYEERLPGGLTLIPSSGGVFEVSFNGKDIFSKKRLDRFPEDEEVQGLLEKALTVA